MLVISAPLRYLGLVIDL